MKGKILSNISDISDTLCFSVVPTVHIQMKVTKQYFPMMLFIMLYRMVLTFESWDEILKCDHSHESL